MNQEQIVEGDKIIADSPFSNPSLRIVIAADIKKYGEERAYEDLKYHSSWDWLMPVVEKIVALNPKDGKEWYYYTMSHCHFRIYANTSFGISGEWKNNSDTTLNATFKTVTEFITWHNSQTHGK